ncbi:putative DNA-binding domain-containing protein [Erythrobacter sp. NFXS35]|uniref:HvfC/BufC family peptide modification chaperone n=1 Tax=Erythrobacter sp. NFXS35 TaxID=2818436 RepID=UPI0032DEBEA9
MRWLEGGQSAMMQAIDHGPAYLPEGLFAGSPDRVLAGMTVHANTISHARLVALEETFPRTREHIGHDPFNAHSRLFIQQPGVTAAALAEIGGKFAAFLLEAGEGAGVADLARFEWCWLNAYHAADAAPLSLDALTGMAPKALLEHTLARHPAASAGRFAPLVHDLISAEVPGLAAADAILIARPYADVLISPASALMAGVLTAAENPVTIGNLLASMAETPADEPAQLDAIMQSLAALINAGALTTA